MRILGMLIVMLISLSPAQAQFGKLMDKAKSVVKGESSGNIAGGLKEALNIGVDEAVSSLSADNGYFESPYKILLPKEALKVTNKLSKVPGFQNVEKDLIAKMNQAAEIAAKKAGPIFLNSIKQMSFKDATNILMGEDDAATRYLEKTSRKELYKSFLPIIQSSLDEVNARSYWNDAVKAYNKIPFTKDLNPELDDHVNNKALDGMFDLVEVKETGIRNDSKLRTSPLLKEVFGQQDK